MSLARARTTQLKPATLARRSCSCETRLLTKRSQRRPDRRAGSQTGTRSTLTTYAESAKSRLTVPSTRILIALSLCVAITTKATSSHALDSGAATNTAHAVGRHGLALDVTAGVGVTQTTSYWATYNGMFWAGFSADDVQFAWMLPTVSVGGWLSSKIALTGRIANFWYVPADREIVNGYVGPELRWLLVPELLLGGGVGVQMLGVANDRDLGVGADLRVAYLPLQLASQAVGVSCEFVPGYVSNAFAYSAGAGIIWLVH